MTHQRRKKAEVRAMVTLGIDACCFDCRYLKTIAPRRLYRCMQYAFRRVQDGECDHKHLPQLTMEEAVERDEKGSM